MMNFNIDVRGCVFHCENSIDFNEMRAYLLTFFIWYVQLKNWLRSQTEKIFLRNSEELFVQINKFSMNKSTFFPNIAFFPFNRLYQIDKLNGGTLYHIILIIFVSFSRIWTLTTATSNTYYYPLEIIIIMINPTTISRSMVMIMMMIHTMMNPTMITPIMTMTLIISITLIMTMKMTLTTITPNMRKMIILILKLPSISMISTSTQEETTILTWWITCLILSQYISSTPHHLGSWKGAFCSENYFTAIRWIMRCRRWMKTLWKVDWECEMNVIPIGFWKFWPEKIISSWT